MKKILVLLLTLVLVTSMVSGATYLFESNTLDDAVVNEKVDYVYVSSYEDMSEDSDKVVEKFDKIISDYEDDVEDCDGESDEDECIMDERENTANSLVDWLLNDDSDSIIPYVKEIFTNQFDELENSIIGETSFVKDLDIDDYFGSSSAWDDIKSDLNDIKDDINPSDKSDFNDFTSDIQNKGADKIRDFIFKDLRFDYFALQMDISIEELKQKKKFLDEMEDVYAETKLDMKLAGVKSSKMDDFEEYLDDFRDRNNDIDDLLDDYEDKTDSLVSEIKSQKAEWDMDDGIWDKIEKNIDEAKYDDWDIAKRDFEEKWEAQLSTMADLRSEIDSLIN